MPYENWFIGVEYAREAASAAQNHVHFVRAGRPRSFSRFFDLANGRRFEAVCADGDGAVETQRHWVWIHGPRRPEAVLKRSLASTRTFDELKGICTSPEGGDNSYLIVDKEAGRFHTITDRLNFSRMFHSCIDDEHFVASRLSLFPTQRLVIDAGGLASLVLNGNCLNNRTLYREIRYLERGSCHEFSGSTPSKTNYWHYRPGERTAALPWHPANATATLWELLVRSVDRVTRGKQVLLALSGGYDSGALLGILGKQLKHPDVVCFSYAYGSPKPGSDAEIAARQTELYGYRHVIVSSYDGDFLGMLDRNAKIGEGLRSPSYEIAAFSALTEQLAGGAHQIMLFGDECLGWGSYRLRDSDDLLGSIDLKAPTFPAIFGTIAGKDAIGRLRGGLDTDYDHLRRKAQEFADPDDAKDFLYLDQRLQFSLLPLRSFIAGHNFPLALPLISTEVLDFMATVPAAHRVDKRLFKTMVRRFLPDLLRIPRATRGQLHPDFDREIVAVSDILEREIVARGWKIEGFFNNEALLALLREFRAKTGKTPRPTSAVAVKRRMKKAVKSILANSRFLEDKQRYFRRLSYNKFARPLGRELTIMNLLYAADFLSAASTRSDIPALAGAHAGRAG